jgi:hypothetical protein
MKKSRFTEEQITYAWRHEWACAKISNASLFTRCATCEDQIAHQASTHISSPTR